MKILVTGSAGMLGTNLVPELARAGHDVHPTDIRLDVPQPWGDRAPSLTHLDVRSRDAIEERIALLRPDLVVHLAAETDVEVCERDQDHAYLTNAIGTKYIALACRRAGIQLAYVSTAGVFDGKKEEPYVEYDEAHPINAYGGSKFAGERYVETFVPEHYIVRAGWMVGGGDRDHKFVAKILQQIKGGARTVYAVGDKLGTPTYAPDFSRCFTKLIETESYGRYHMACLGRGSRFDVAKRIVRALGAEVEVVEVDSAFFSRDYPTTRPRSEMMRNLHLDLQGLNTMRPWEIALDEYLETAFADLRQAVTA